MAQTADIVLNDGAETPVARTFKPTTKVGLLIGYGSDSESRPALYPTISLGMRAPKPGVNRKVTLRVAVPYDVTENSVTRVESVTGFLDIIVPSSASTLHVDHLMAYIAGVIGEAQVTDAVAEGRFPY